jgi:5'-methylthioadenosine phosphorylase
MGTPYGIPAALFLGKIEGRTVVFVRRHGLKHDIPPHKINHRANIDALHQLGVKRIIATNAVGAITKTFRPRSMAVPHDFIDFTDDRSVTFHESTPVMHVDMTQPYCPEMRKTLIEAARRNNIRTSDRAVLLCTSGPRFETPAEVEMFRRLGVDLIGMTGAAEAVLARELGMCYATVCLVTNMAAGLQKRLTMREVVKNAVKIRPIAEKLLSEAVRTIPHNRACHCAHALENAGI